MTKGVSLVRSTGSAASVATSFLFCCSPVGSSSMMAPSLRPILLIESPVEYSANSNRMVPRSKCAP